MFDDEKKKKKERRAEIKKKLRTEIYTEIQPLAIGSLAMICSTLANQAVPRLIGRVLDQHSSSSTGTCTATQGGTAMVSSLAFVVIGGGVASFLRTTMLNRAQDNIAARLRRDTLETLLTRRDFEWFQVGDEQEMTRQTTTPTKRESDVPKKGPVPSSSSSSSPGAITTILTTDITNVSETLTTTLANAIRSTCSCLFATTHMLSLNASLLGLSIGIVPVIGSAAVILNKFVKKKVAQQRQMEACANAFAEERLNHVGTVKMSSRELDEVRAYQTILKKWVQLGRTVSMAKGLFMGFMFAASSGALFMVFQAGGKAVATGQMTNGELTSFATYTFLLGLGTSGIIKAAGQVVQGFVSAERVYDLTGDNMTNKVKETTTLCVDVGSIESLSFLHVDFWYTCNPGRMILKDICLKFQRGQVVALVGVNGSGKSTLASILAALYKPRAGRVLAAGNNTVEVDFHALDRKTQSQLVQLVPQHPALFDMSIRENVAYANPCSTDSEVNEALHAANCDEFLSKLDNGWEYKVGRNGSKLSGGQRQRLALARALLSDPCLLVFDEPTNSLDVQGENAVADAVRACRSSGSKQRALLLISHRVASLELADIIVVLKDGKIVEQGTFQQLSENKESALCHMMPDL